MSWPDLRRLGALAVGGAASLLWPRRLDPLLAAAWLTVYRAAAPATLDLVAARMRRLLPELAADTPERARHLAELHVRSRIEDMWGRVRGLHRSSWRPRIEVDGLAHLHAARARGRGVILWCMRVGSATVIKQGLYEAGLPLTHLSRADHGSLTTTRLGIGVVAPLYRRVEDAVLRERIQIPLGDSLAYLRTVSARLQANECVSIFGEHAGRQAVEVDVLGVRRRFALGAPSIAWRDGAGLVTAYATREGAFHYRVTVEEEIPVATTVPRRRFAEDAVREFARRLERGIRRHPADWQAWFYLDQLERPAGPAPEPA